MHEPDRALQHIITIQEVIPMTTPAMTAPSSAIPTPSAVWVNPRALLDRVTLLWEDALVVANPGADIAEQIPARLAAGEPVQALLEQKVTVIPLASISKVHSNRKSSDIAVHYHEKGKARMANIGFADGATRDQVLIALQQRLGNRFRLTVRELNLFQAAIKPGITLLVTMFFVVAGYMGALEMAAGEVHETHGRNALLKWLFIELVSILGPIGVLIVGGLIVLGLSVWFVKRVSNPPTQMTLARAK
jgi:uncharacterized membrane protein